MGKMNIDPDTFTYKANLEEEAVAESMPISQKKPETNQEEDDVKSLLDRLFSGKAPKKIEKVNRTFYLERDIVEKVEEIAKNNDISSSLVVNDLLKELLI